MPAWQGDDNGLQVVHRRARARKLGAWKGGAASGSPVPPSSGHLRLA